MNNSFPDDDITYNNLVSNLDPKYLKDLNNEFGDIEDEKLRKAQICDFLIFYSRDRFGIDVWNDFVKLYSGLTEEMVSKESIKKLIKIGLLSENKTITNRVRNQLDPFIKISQLIK